MKKRLWIIHPIFATSAVGTTTVKGTRKTKVAVAVNQAQDHVVVIQASKIMDVAAVNQALATVAVIRSWKTTDVAVVTQALVHVVVI